MDFKEIIRCQLLDVIILHFLLKNITPVQVIDYIAFARAGKNEYERTSRAFQTIEVCGGEGKR